MRGAASAAALAGWYAARYGAAQARRSREPAAGSRSAPPSAPGSPACPRCRARCRGARRRRRVRRGVAGRRSPAAGPATWPGRCRRHERACASATAPTASPTTGSTTRWPSSPTSATRGRAHPRPRPPRPVRADLAGPAASPVGRAARRARARRVVIETGARYLLDPWHKHAPTLLHDEPGPGGSTSCAGPSDRRRPGRRGGVLLGRGRARRRCREDGAGTGWSTAAPRCVDARRGAPACRSASSRSPACSCRTSPDWRRLRAALGAPARFGSPSTSATAAAWSRRPRAECVAGPADHAGQRADRRHAPRACTSTWSSATARSTSRRCWRALARGRLPRPGRGRAAPALATPRPTVRPVDRLAFLRGRAAVRPMPEAAVSRCDDPAPARSRTR